MSAYAATLDLTTLMDNLSNAGVPDEVITYVLSGGSNSDAEDVLMKMPQKQSLMLSLLKQAQPDLAVLSLSSTAADGSSNTLSRYLLLLLL